MNYTPSSLPHSLNWSSVYFSVSPSFLAKTALTDRGASALLSVSIPALSSIVSEDLPDDLLLCPVRAIRIYIDCTSLMRDNKRLFFISYLDHIQKDILSVSLSRWIVKTIQLCYELEGAKLRSSAKVHSVRALATSLAFFKQASMEQVIRAGTWVFSNTFISYYLKDLNFIQGNLSRMGPLVTAGIIIPSSLNQA